MTAEAAPNADRLIIAMLASEIIEVAGKAKGMPHLAGSAVAHALGFLAGIQPDPDGALDALFAVARIGKESAQEAVANGTLRGGTRCDPRGDEDPCQ